jgi:hypothetical protein
LRHMWHGSTNPTARISSPPAKYCSWCLIVGRHRSSIAQSFDCSAGTTRFGQRLDKAPDIEGSLLGIIVRWLGLSRDGDVTVDLVAPTGVDRAMHGHEGGEGGLKASRAGPSAGRGAGVQDPEHPTDVTRGRLGHHQGNKTMARRAADGWFAAAKALSRMDIERGQVSLVHVQETSWGMRCLPHKSPLFPPLSEGVKYSSDRDV